MRVLMRIKIAPEAELHRCSLLFTMLFETSVTAMDLRREAQAYAELLSASAAASAAVRRPCRAASAWACSPTTCTATRARTSSRHSWPTHRDRFEVELFALNAHRDNVSEKFALYADRFVDLAGKSETQIADEIDAAGLAS